MGGGAGDFRADASWAIDQVASAWRDRELDGFLFGHTAETISAFDQVGEPRRAAVYGEVPLASLTDILETAGVKPGMKYYDLGSGTGKTVLFANLLGLDATGVELAPGRWK